LRTKSGVAELWSGLNYRQTINDNMLVTVMIETLEGVAMAEEIAATHGVDAIILGNNDPRVSRAGARTIRDIRTRSSRCTMPR
jgi:2-keto-3-deoxy-L-rhamnonate aldolase RhmA